METLNLGIDGLDDVEQIGAGGTSRVYRATQIELDRLVALKVLNASDDPNVAKRFDRERKAMGRLSLNEGIVPIYSSGMTDRGEPYLIMPYYPNGSLQDRIDNGPLPWTEAVGYVASATETMAAAHEAGVVHLDLKPANVLLSSTGAPRIADFGIAKLMSEQAASNNTGPSFTPTFSAPEILLGGKASPASDVYGLAATLWALIAGRPPFRAIDGEDNTLMAVVGRVVHQPAGDLRAVAPDSICSVIEIAMAKDPTDRYPTAGAFRQALAGAVDLVERANGGRTIAAIPGPAAEPTIQTNGAHNAASDLGRAAPTQAVDHGPGVQEIGVKESGLHPPPVPAKARQSQSSLRFEAAVPPRLLPAGNTRSAGLADAVDRYSGWLMGLSVAAVLVVAAFVGLRLLDSGGGEVATGGEEVAAVATDLSTSSTARNAEAGAGGADAAAGPTATTRPTTTSTTRATTATTPAPTAATTPTTAEPTTTTTEDATTTEDTTTTTEDTTTTTEDTTTTTEDTTTTTEDTTTTSTTSIPQLGAPTGLTASYRNNGRVVLNWNAPGNADGLAGYTIVRNGSAIGSVGPGTTRVVDTDLANFGPGDVISYQVRADGPPSGNPASSGLSQAATATIPGDNQ